MHTSTSPYNMTLSDSMHDLAKVLASAPLDLKIEVIVTTKIHDDVPNDFVRDGSGFTRVISAKDGDVIHSIRLNIHD